MIAPRLLTICLTATALLACSDPKSHMDDAAAALAEYYATHPFEREWSVETIAVLDAQDRLMTKVVINSETDVNRIMSMSRMEQFTVAKLACPKIEGDLKKALGSTRVWITLVTEGKEITSSICPQ